MTEFMEKIEATEDVGQKRYLMQKKFDELIEGHVSEDLNLEDRIKSLEDSDGYLYKLSQDFLTASSTLEKRKKLEKIIEYLD